MNNIRSILVLALSVCYVMGSMGQTSIRVIDDDLQAGQNYTWTADNTYLLDGLVFLEVGANLTIEAGTIIRGVQNPSDEASPFSALIISQGATITAKGDPCNPIVFTAEEDDFVNLLGPGLWGGLVILGQAPVHTNGDGNTRRLFGLERGDNQAVFGGNLPDDNSGLLSYTSIRYAGADLGAFRLPGLTLAGVGSGTQIDHVEVFSGAGIGIAMRGGTVNTKYLASAFNGEDAFFYTLGYQGLGQFHFSVALPTPAGIAASQLGDDTTIPPGTTRPSIYNATYLGAGLDNVGNDQEEQAAVSFSEEAAGRYVNSVFADFSGFGVFVEDAGESNQDSYQQLLAENIELQSNAWIQIRSANIGGLDANSLILPDPNGDQGIGALITHLETNQNDVVASADGLLRGISRLPDGQLDPRPAALTGIFQSTEPTLDDPYFTAANYRGAFNEDLWLAGWTALDFYKYLPECDLELEVSSTDVSCFGDDDGSIDLQLTGNISELVIDWNVDALDGNAQLINLAPGTYSVTVTNAECCEQTAEIIIAGPTEALVVDCSNIQNATDPVKADGSITITTAGGGAPETLILTRPDGTQSPFSFSDGSSLLVSELSAGDYNAAVTDSFGCTVDCDFTIESESDCIVIRDSDLVAGSTYTWTAGNCYLLDGLVFLEATGSLTIEPGVIVKGKASPSNGQNTSALVIGKGAAINAQGTEANPIIFTAEADDENVAADLTAADKGLWGGLAILGDAPIPNPESDNGEAFWEVLDEIGGAGQYGGTGTQTIERVLSYVSVRHAGAAILPNQVFPALTFAAIRETAQLDHLEVFAAADRGIAFYSGTAQLSYATATFCQGPAFSWQDGYNGKGQFWFALSDPGSTNLIADHQGYINGATQDTVVSAPEIYNATYIGGGGTGNTSAVALRFRQSSAGVYGNSIFTHFNGNALEVEDIAGDDNDSQSLLEAETDFSLRNNLFWAFSAGDTIQVNNGLLAASVGAADPEADFLVDHLVENRSIVANPRLVSVSNIPNGQLDPRPQECAAFFTRTVYPDSVFFDPTTNYKGAFDKENELWLKTWTALDEVGYLPSILPPLNLENCLMTLDSGVFFLTEFLMDSISDEDVQKQKAIHAEYADLVRECNCGDNSVARLMLWETRMLTDITNGRSGVEDSTIIDTSALNAIFDLGLLPVFEPQAGNYCGTQSGDDTEIKDSIPIAILDSGIDLSHEQLNDYAWLNQVEFVGAANVDDDGNCLPDDIRGFDFIAANGTVFDIDKHGTHLAGIVTGAYPIDISPQLMNLKVFERGSLSNISRGSVFDLICAIHYAINEGAKVINLSIGYWSSEASIPLYNALKRALAQNITVIVSTGNDGVNVDNRRLKPTQGDANLSNEPIYEDRWPVKYKLYGTTDPDFPNLESLIGVGASVAIDATQGFQFSSYSNFGDGTMDLSTKGVFLSTVPGNDFETFQGTSMAVAYLTRWISIAKGYKPDLSNQTIMTCLSDPNVVRSGTATSNSNLSVKRLDEVAFLDCLGVLDSLTGFNGEIPAQDLTTRPFFNVHVREELVVRFGDGSKSFQQIGIIVKDNYGIERFQLQCQGNLIIWDTILENGEELPLGQYLLETYVNGEEVENPGLSNFIKFN